MGDEKEKEKDNEAAQLKLNIVEKLLPRAKGILETLKDSKIQHAIQNDNQNHPASICAIIEAMQELEKLDIGLYREVLSRGTKLHLQQLLHLMNLCCQNFSKKLN